MPEEEEVPDDVPEEVPEDVPELVPELEDEPSPLLEEGGWEDGAGASIFAGLFAATSPLAGSPLSPSKELVSPEDVEEEVSPDEDEDEVSSDEEKEVALPEEGEEVVVPEPDEDEEKVWDDEVPSSSSEDEEESSDEDEGGEGGGGPAFSFPRLAGPGGSSGLCAARFLGSSSCWVLDGRAV